MLLAFLAFACDRLYRIGWLALKLLIYVAIFCLLVRLIAWMVG